MADLLLSGRGRGRGRGRGHGRSCLQLAVGGWRLAVGSWRLAVGFAVASLGVACAHLRLRKYAKCRVETLYLSEIVGAEASATSVSGTRVSIMTKATPEAVAGCTGGPRSAIANPARGGSRD